MHDTKLSYEEREALAALIAARGRPDVCGAAGISENTLANALAGFDVRRTTVFSLRSVIAAGARSTEKGGARADGGGR